MTLNPGWKPGRKKIALVMGGGGSLGAYEAGALIELMYALDVLNADLLPEDRFVIDVISGASAGGMSAAMMARIMLYDYPAGRSDLYRAWVQDIRMSDSEAGPGLLEDDEAQTNALLSKKIVRRIAHAYLSAPTRDGRAVSAASFAPEELRLRLTLTNMNGLDYTVTSRSVTDSAPFVTTRFSDTGRFLLGREPDASLWGPDKAGIRDAAIACGNFPLAFQPQGLLRDKPNYPHDPRQSSQAYFPRELTFVDGGMFDNEPLGKAINAATDSDTEGGGETDPNRLFLMIHPNIARGSHRNETGDDPSSGVAYTENPGFGILAQAGRLLGMLLAENAVSDWVRAHEVNAIVQWRDEFIPILTTLVLETTVGDRAALIRGLDDLILRIATSRARSTPGLTAEEYLEKIRDAEKFVPRDPRLQGEKLLIFDKILFILDHISELQEKRVLWFEAIGHEELPLAGSQIMGFAGFFEEEWRIYDYRRGRVDAYRALSGWRDGENRSAPERAILGTYDREAAEKQPTRGLEKDREDGNNDYLTARSYWQARTRIPDFPMVTWNDVPEGLQNGILERVLDRLLKAFDPSFGVKVVLKAFGKGKLRDILAGSAGEGGAKSPPRPPSAASPGP